MFLLYAYIIFLAIIGVVLPIWLDRDDKDN